MLEYNKRYQTCDEIYTDPLPGSAATAVSVIVGVVLAFACIIISFIVWISWRAWKRRMEAAINA
jgi:hypothetical protein